jgi:hypothetical protein
MDVFFVPPEQDAAVDLYGLGYRCLHEPASRRLDGKIYCAVHNVSAAFRYFGKGSSPAGLVDE